MTEDELLKFMRGVADSRREPPAVRTWERVQARRADARLRRLRRRIAIGLATALSFALAVAGIRGYLRVEHSRAEVTMTAASAIVIQRHLAQSDAMIGAFRSAVASGTWDDQLTDRARDLQVATRRIQGGRIEADSALVGLLADLDFVLTEIAGYGDLKAQRETESEMIEYSISARQVVPRIHAWVGAVAGGNDNEGLDP